jgi:hypothetical protein
MSDSLKFSTSKSKTPSLTSSLATSYNSSIPIGKRQNKIVISSISSITPSSPCSSNECDLESNKNIPNFAFREYSTLSDKSFPKKILNSQISLLNINKRRSVTPTNRSFSSDLISDDSYIKKYHSRSPNSIFVSQSFSSIRPVNLEIMSEGILSKTFKSSSSYPSTLKNLSEKEIFSHSSTATQEDKVVEQILPVEDSNNVDKIAKVEDENKNEEQPQEFVEILTFYLDTKRAVKVCLFFLPYIYSLDTNIDAC